MLRLRRVSIELSWYQTRAVIWFENSEGVSKITLTARPAERHNELPCFHWAPFLTFLPQQASHLGDVDNHLYK